ncbi:phage tail protein [Roseovarius sp. D0-M9]
MRAQASLGIPLPLVSMGGRVIGIWVVEAVREGQRIFERGGAPLRQEFDIKMRRYDGGLRSLLGPSSIQPLPNHNYRRQPDPAPQARD